MVSCICCPSCPGGWDGKIAWAQELETSQGSPARLCFEEGGGETEAGREEGRERGQVAFFCTVIELVFWIQSDSLI